MHQAGQGNMDAANQFLKKIDGWVNEKTEHIAKQVWGDAVDIALAKDGAQDVLIKMMKPEARASHFNGESDLWSQFSTAFQRELRDNYVSILTRMQKERANNERLVAAISDIPAATVAGGSIERFSSEQIDAAKGLLKPYRLTPEQALFKQRRSTAIDRALGTLRSDQHAVLRGHAEGLSLNEIAAELNTQALKPHVLTAQAIRDIGTTARRHIRRDDARARDALASYHEPDGWAR